MRVPITPRRAWPVGQTIVPVPVPAIDLGWIMLYASRDAWPAAAEIEISLEFFDPDDNAWKPIVRITTVGGVATNRHGTAILECHAGTRKRDPRTNQTAPYFRHIWPKADTPRMPPEIRLRVETNVPINSSIEVDW